MSKLPNSIITNSISVNGEKLACNTTNAIAPIMSKYIKLFSNLLPEIPMFKKNINANITITKYSLPPDKIIGSATMNKNNIIASIIGVASAVFFLYITESYSVSKRPIIFVETLYISSSFPKISFGLFINVFNNSFSTVNNCSFDSDNSYFILFSLFSSLRIFIYPFDTSDNIPILSITFGSLSPFMYETNIADISLGTSNLGIIDFLAGSLPKNAHENNA